MVSNLLDEALAGFSGKRPERAERARTWWLLGSSVLVLAGGAVLVLLLDFAPWIFGLSALGQLVYLAWLAPRYFDVADPPDARGRRQTTNAAAIYLLVTAFTIWAASAGKLVPWSEVPIWALALGAGAIAAHIGYVLKGLLWRPRAGGDGGTDPLGAPSLVPSKVMLSAFPGSHPLQAMDDHLVGDVDPASLGLSVGLCRDLAAWSAEFVEIAERAATAGEDMRPVSVERMVDAARELGQRVKLERGDLIVYVEEPGYGPIEIDLSEPRPGGAA